jgi:hypothetical protein
VIRHLLVIGAQRCGTTYLSTLLDGHPDITMARPSHPEPKVFCNAEASARGVRWYRETYFRHAGGERLLGDKSTSYLEDGAAASRASGMLGEAHVVAVLRDPVERAVSNWRFSTKHGLETRPLEIALRDNLVQPAPWDPTLSSVSPFAYLERGRYMDYLPAWAAAFPDTTHVVFLRELVEEDTALEGLWRALEVDPGAAPERSRAVVNENDGAPPALNPELSGTLRSYFEVSNRVLRAHVGRPLPW